MQLRFTAHVNCFWVTHLQGKRWTLSGDVEEDRGLTSCNFWWDKTLDVDLICLIFTSPVPCEGLVLPHWWFDKDIGSLSSFSMLKTELMHVRNSQSLLTGLNALNSGDSLLWEVSMGLIDLVCMCVYKYVHPHTDYHHVLVSDGLLTCCYWAIRCRGHNKTFIHIHTDRCLSANGCLYVFGWDGEDWMSVWFTSNI